MMFTLSVACQVIWDGRRRYIPGILAISFSLILITLQCGIFYGLISSVTVPIVESTADIWVAYPKTRAGDLARPISRDWKDALLSLPEIEQVDELVMQTNYWTTRSAVNDLVFVVGLNPGPESLGPVGRLSKYERRLLMEPGSVILDVSDQERLDVSRIGDDGQINGRAVRVVGLIPGMITLTGSCVLCSLETARMALRLPADQTTYLLANCRPGVDIPEVVRKINSWREVSAWTAEGFANQTMAHWIGKTKAGVAVAFIALLGLAVGGAVTSQTLYAATASLVKEFAAMGAMGVPRFRMRSFVLTQSIVMSVVGLFIGIPAAILLAALARSLGTEALVPFWLISTASIITLFMGIFSGLFAAQSLRNVEPATLLRV
jgi:putative ABC transport system permease protein